MHEPVSRSAVSSTLSKNTVVSVGRPAKLGPFFILSMLVPPSGPVTETLTCFPDNFWQCDLPRRRNNKQTYFAAGCKGLMV